MIKNTFEELRLSGQLPSPSGVGMKILKLTQREDYSAEEIGAAIMADSVLTGRILKIANSARSASIEPIATVAEATMRLGVRTVRNVALGLSLLSENRSGACQAFDYDGYWSRSLARAVAGQVLSQRTGTGIPAEAYILGLLSEIGKLALASVYPEDYSTMLERGYVEPKQFNVLERKLFEIDHMEVTALMLEEWGLPESFQVAVKAYELHDEREGLNEEPELTGLLQHAHAIARACLADQKTTAEEWAEIVAGVADCRAALELDETAFVTACQGIVAEWKEWGGTLGIPTQSSVQFNGLEKRARNAPKAAPVPEQPAESKPVRRPPRPRGMRILIVDDDPMALKLLERVLVNRGYEVFTASNGDEALEQALKVSPNMVLADWMMPEMDGVDLCRALRRIECGRRMYFLLVTGRDDEDRVVEAFDAGVDDYVVKPFNAKLLLARIKGGQRVISLQDQVDQDKETMRRQVAELGRLTRKLRTAALTDVLTELPNRRYAMKRMEQEWAASVRAEKPLSIIMMDIDHFKAVNDQYGHDIGDVVLKQTAAVMSQRSRDSEDVCRLGGEEFCIICENSTTEGAAVAAERIRAAIEANRIQSGPFDGNVTISLGVAQRTEDMPDVSALIKAADEAVYAAKTSGRNRVCLYAPPENQAKKSA